MLTIVELSKQLGIEEKDLKRFVNYHKDKSLFFSKKYTQNHVLWKGKPIVQNRLMYVIEDERIDAFKKYWDTRKEKIKPYAKRYTNGSYNADRLSWTNQALDCYDARCTCKNCMHHQTCKELETYLGEKKMKTVVIRLVKELGIPPERIIEND